MHNDRRINEQSMQKKFAPESAFFDLRALTALFVILAAVFVALFARANSSGPVLQRVLAVEGPTPTPTPQSVLYDQYDNFATKEPINIPSQDAETALDFFDSQAADDFTVPAGQTWQVTELDVLGAKAQTACVTTPSGLQSEKVDRCRQPGSHLR